MSTVARGEITPRCRGEIIYRYIYAVVRVQSFGLLILLYEVIMNWLFV